MGCIGIRPFAAGLLTDRRIDRAKLAPDDRMQDPQWDRLYDQLAELRKALDEEPSSWTRFAIQFSLAHPLVASTVVGINSPSQLQSVVSAAEDRYPDGDLLGRAHEVCLRFREEFGVKGNTAGVPIY